MPFTARDVVINLEYVVLPTLVVDLTDLKFVLHHFVQEYAVVPQIIYLRLNQSWVEYFLSRWQSFVYSIL
jgi:hypothetical protein